MDEISEILCDKCSIQLDLSDCLLCIDHFERFQSINELPIDNEPTCRTCYDDAIDIPIGYYGEHCLYCVMDGDCDEAIEDDRYSTYIVMALMDLAAEEANKNVPMYEIICAHSCNFSHSKLGESLLSIYMMHYEACEKRK